MEIDTHPIHFAIIHRDIDLFRILVQGGADINIQTSTKETPIEMLVEYNTTDITTLIATNQYYIPPTEEYSKSNLSSISIDILNKRLVTEQKKADFINLLSKHIKNVVSAIFTPFPYQIKSE